MKIMPLIPQQGVHHKVFGGKGSHNAIWNFVLSPDKRIYFSLCSELIESSYARLYEYNLQEDKFDLLFRVEDVVLPAYRTIRPSKIHTSISFLPNGHLLMATHTTDRSPVHPYWLPEAYYAHPWEGFSGSNLIEYDPDAKAAYNLGIPVPYESIYGGIYVQQTNRFYFTGFLRGHLYSYDLETRQVKDYGQVTEYGCFLIHLGTDGKLYWSSRSGYLARLNVEADQIESLNVRFSPSSFSSVSQKIMRLDYAINLPDGRMLFAVVLTDELYIFDPKTDTLTGLGSYGQELLPPDEERVRASVYAPAIDRDGVLWYGLESRYPNNQCVVTLACWDVFHGGRPELLGTLGSVSTGRVVASLSESFIRDDVLYFADTNHSNDMPGVISIDLARFRPHKYEAGELIDDLFIDSRAEQYREMDTMTKNYAEFLANNPYAVKCRDWYAWRLWRAVLPEESAVRSVSLTPEGKVTGICGNENRKYSFVADETGVQVLPLGEEVCTVPLMVGEKMEQLGVPGRQYKAIVSASAPLTEGKMLVGTQDGVLGIVDGTKICRLGRVCVNGPVRALASSADGSIVYGVGGDGQDFGLVFRYTEEKGIEELGALHFDLEEQPGIHCSFEPCCCDVSGDGKTVAIGVADRLGVVYRLSF